MSQGEDPPVNKSNVFERDWSNFDQENFVLNYFDIDWPNILKIFCKNVNSTTNNFLDAINSYWINMLHLKNLIIISLKINQESISIIKNY